MDVDLIQVECDEEYAHFELRNKDNECLVSYDVELNKGKALISYETTEKFKNQGFASMGLNMLKDKLFKGNQILILELINLSSDYSRKVAENAEFFSRSGNLDYYIAIHPFAEQIIKNAMQSIDKTSPLYKKQKKLLEVIENLRQREKTAREKMINKLELLREQQKIATDEEYKRQVNSEIKHIEKILGITPNDNLNR